MMCDECKNNLGSWAKAELSAAQANRLEQHLAECESCSVAAHNELAIVTAMRESQEIPPSSPGFEKQVLDCKKSSASIKEERAQEVNARIARGRNGSAGSQKGKEAR